MSKFIANIEAELQLDKAKKQLDEFVDSHRKITLDVEVGHDSAKQIKKSVETALKNIKADGSAISKQLADSFNITDKSVVKDLNKQINAMMSDLAKTWDGKSLDLLKADGFYDGLNKLAETVVNNANVIQSKMGIYDKFFDYFKNKKIYVSDELKYAMGGDEYKQLLNDNVGKIVRDASKGISINSIWDEMTDLFPEHFSKDVTNQVEQITRAFDVLKQARADIEKMIPAKNLSADKLLGITDSAYVDVLNSANELKNKLEQSLNVATENAKTKIDLDVAIDKEKIVSDIRSALQTASTTAGDGIDIQMNLGEEDIITKMRSAINKLSSGDEPLNLDVHIDKTTLQAELNTALKDLDLPVHFKIDAAELEADLRRAIANIGDVEINLKVNTQAVQNSLNNTNAGKAWDNILNSVNQQGKIGTSVFQKFGKTLNEAFSTFTLANLLEDTIYKVVAAGKKAIDVVYELDDINKNLQMATGEDESYVDGLMEDYKALAQELGVLNKTVAESADNFLRQGRSISETSKLIEDSMVLSAVANIDGNESAEILTATINGYQLAAEEASRVNDVISSIDLHSASTAQGIGEALTKSASMAHNMGLPLEKTAAIIATIKDVTQDSDASIGNSVKSILSRMNQIRAGKFIDEETNESLNDVEAVLKRVNITMRDANNQFLDSETIIDNVAEKWDTLNSNSKKAVATAMAGTYQYNKLVALLDNYDQVLELTNVALNSEGTALEKFEKSYINSLEAKTNALKSSLESLASSTISDELIGGVVDATKDMVNLTEETGILKASLIGIGASGSLFGFQKMVSWIGSATQEISNLGKAMNMLNAGNVTGNAFDTLLTLTSGLSDAQIKLVLTSTALTESQRMQILMARGVSQADAQMMLSSYGLATAQGTATASTVTLSSALSGLKAVCMAHPFITLAVAIGAVTAVAVKAVDALTVTLEEQQEKVEDATKAYEEAQGELESITSELESQEKTMDDLLAKDNLTYTEKGELERLKKITQELKIQQDIAEKKAALTQKDLAKESSNLYEMQYGDYEISENAVDHYIRDVQKGIGKGIELVEAEDDISALLAGYKLYKEMRDEALEAGQSEDYSRYDGFVEDINASLTESLDNLMSQKADITPYYEEIKDTPLKELTTEQKEIIANYEEIGNAIKLIYSYLDPNYLKSLEVDQIFSTDGIEKSKEELVELAKSGELTPEMIAGYDKLGSALWETSLSAQDLCDEIYAIAEAQKSVGGSTGEMSLPSFSEVFNSADFADAKEELLELAKSGEITPSVLQSNEEYRKLLDDTGLSAKEATDKIIGLLTTTQKLSGTAQGLDKLKDAYREAFDEEIGFVTAETLESLPDAFKKLESYDLFKSIVGNTDSTKAEVQEAFNDIVTEYINTYSIINDTLLASEAETQAVVDNLTQMGITNAQEYIDNARTAMSSYYSILTESQQVYAKYLQTKDENDLKYFEDLVSKNQKAILENFGQDYLEDYNNWCDLLKGKASAYNDYIAEYMKGYEKQKALGNGLASPDPWYQENVVLAGMTGAKPAYLKTDYGDGLNLNFGDDSKFASSLKFDSSKLTDGLNKDKTSKSKMEESFDWIKRALKAVQRTITNLGKTVDATYKKWTTRNSALASQISKVKEEISLQQKAYKTYMAEANAVGLSSKYKTLVQSGKMDIETITDEKLADKIQKYQDYYDKALACQDAILDLENEVASLARTQFDHVVSEYEDKLSTIEHEVSMIDGMISQVETRGYLVSAKYYGELIEKEQGNLSTLKAEYNALNKALTEAMNTGNIEKYSESWYEMTAQINDVEKAIQDSNTALIEYQNSIRDLRWEAFDKMMEMMGEIQEESDFLRELMSEHKLFDEKGGITDKGQATMGLLTVDYASHMAMADEYRNALSEINKDLANDPNNQTLLERKRELIGLQQEAILAAQDEKQAIKDLYSEGCDAFLEYMNQVISKRKDLLDTTKDLYDYEKSVREMNEEISSLEKQKLALMGDNSEEAILKNQQIDVALKDARENLQESLYERQIQDEQEMLDIFAEDTENFINQRLDNIDGLLQSAVDATNANAESIKETLSNEAVQVGTTLSDAMNGIWSAGGTFASVVDVYQQNFSGLMTTTNSILYGIKETLVGMVQASDKRATNDGITSNVVSSSNTISKPSTSTGGYLSNNETGSSSTKTNINNSSSITNKGSGSSSTGTKSDGSFFKYQKFSGNKSKLHADTSIIDRLKYNDFSSGFNIRKEYYVGMGLGSESSYTGTTKQNKAMISWMNKNGFAKGGTIGGLIRRSGEDGFVLARTGEEIFSLEKIDHTMNLFDSIEHSALKDMNNLTKSLLPNNAARQNSVNVSIGDINMYEVNDPQELQRQIVNTICTNKRVERAVGDMLFNKNELAKYHWKY